MQAECLPPPPGIPLPYHEAAPEEAEAARLAAAAEADDAVLGLEELQELDLPSMAVDKYKSRLLQRSLARGGPDVATFICERMEPHFMQLVQDACGNYLAQKLLEACEVERFDRLFATLAPHVRELALDVHGTRAVQKAVEQAISRGKVEEVLAMLPNELILLLSRNVTGFHVVVKLVECLPTKDVGPLLEVLCSTPEQALRLGGDQWGCCVLKKCIDRSEGASRQAVVDAILGSVLPLVQDAFGNYAVQHLVLLGPQRPNAYVTTIIDALRGQMFELSLQKFSSNVLEKCLLHSCDTDRNKVINEILNPATCLPSQAVQQLLFHAFGNYVLQQALDVAREPQLSLLIEHCRKPIQEVMRCAPGESVQPPGNLSAEHARRLALKLVKKYPTLADGLEFDPSFGGSYPQYFDFYAAGNYGVDAYGPWTSGPLPAAAVCGYGLPAFGAYHPAAFGPPRLPEGKGSSAGPRSKARGSGSKRPGQEQRALSRAGAPPRERSQHAAEGNPQTLRVGRVVGYWPNYTVTYDEVTLPGAAPAGGRSTVRTKKARGKAAASRHAAGPPPAAEEEVPK